MVFVVFARHHWAAVEASFWFICICHFEWQFCRELSWHNQPCRGKWHDDHRWWSFFIIVRPWSTSHMSRRQCCSAPAAVSFHVCLMQWQAIFYCFVKNV